MLGRTIGALHPRRLTARITPLGHALIHSGIGPGDKVTVGSRLYTTVHNLSPLSRNTASPADDPVTLCNHSGGPNAGRMRPFGLGLPPVMSARRSQLKLRPLAARTSCASPTTGCHCL